MADAQELARTILETLRVRDRVDCVPGLTLILEMYGKECFSAGLEAAAAACPICHGTGELREAVQAWDVPGAPAPDCEACAAVRALQEKGQP